jgi:hypothetical protein
MPPLAGLDFGWFGCDSSPGILIYRNGVGNVVANTPRLPVLVLRNVLVALLDEIG